MNGDYDSMEKNMDMMETKIQELYIEQIHEERENLARTRQQKLTEELEKQSEKTDNLLESATTRYCHYLELLGLIAQCMPHSFNVS